MQVSNYDPFNDQCDVVCLLDFHGQFTHLQRYRLSLNTTGSAFVSRHGRTGVNYNGLHKVTESRVVLPGLTGLLLRYNGAWSWKGGDSVQRTMLSWMLVGLVVLTGTVAAHAAQDQDIDELIEALGDEDEGVRQAAAWALTEIGPVNRDTIPALTTVLLNGNRHVRELAAQALGMIGPEAQTAVSALGRALHDEDEDVREAAAWALAEIGLATVPVLVRALWDIDRAVRRLAAQALGMIGLEAGVAIPTLNKALQDEDQGVRRWAAWALKKIQGSKETRL